MQFVLVAPGWVRTPVSDAEMDEMNGTSREAEFEPARQRIGLRRIAGASETGAGRGK